MAVSEFGLQLWATPPTRDNDKSATTYSIIKPVLERSFGNKVKIFLQGSYANSTNIKKDSDIDIVVCYQNSYFYSTSNLSESELTLFNINFSSASYFFSTFKDEIQSCLEDEFGKPPKTERKDKCIRVFGNTSRVDADIVPCFVHKRFKTHNATSAEGVEFVSDKGEHSISFPLQHVENGESKNRQTGGKYKDTVRILKNCKKELLEKKIISEDLISSFFIECLVWNISNSLFNKSYYLDIVKSVLAQIYNDMQNEEIANKYTEANNLFYLMHPSRTNITRQHVLQFTEAAYGYIFNL